MNEPERRGASFDSLILAAVRVFSIAAGIATTMVLAHQLSLSDFGTYAQLNLTVTVAGTLTTLGLSDAANYFFNKFDNRTKTPLYTNTIVSLQVVVGVVVALLVVVLSPGLATFFSNPVLAVMWPYVFLRPLFVNVGLTLQVIAVSVGRARAIAFRSVVFSSAKLAGAVVSVSVTEDVRILLAVVLALDIASALWFWAVVSRAGVVPGFTVIQWVRVKAILAFSLPMAAYVGLGALSREIDKLVVAGAFNTEEYAIYSNSATLLPFDVVSSSFLVVAIPILTRFLGSGQHAAARRLVLHYLEIGYLTTVPLALSALLVAPDVVRVLFGEKYLSGVTIFSLYLVNSMLRFASVSLVLSASGKTRLLMIVSVVSLVAGVGLSFLGLEVFGFVGPAVASVVAAAITTTILLIFSARQMEARLRDLVQMRTLVKFILSAVCFFIVFKILISFFGESFDGELVRVLVFCPAFLVAMFMVNRKALVHAFTVLNAMK